MPDPLMQFLIRPIPGGQDVGGSKPMNAIVGAVSETEARTFAARKAPDYGYDSDIYANQSKSTCEHWPDAHPPLPHGEVKFTTHPL
jgi:hypothetical protein